VALADAEKVKQVQEQMGGGRAQVLYRGREDGEGRRNARTRGTLFEPRRCRKGARSAEDARACGQHRRQMTVFDYAVLAIVRFSI
jgi:hypothetical protein